MKDMSCTVRFHMGMVSCIRVNACSRLCQARSISSLQAEALAARRDGLAGLADIDCLAGLGSDAKFPGNIERDFGRRIKTVLKIDVKPLSVPVDVSKADPIIVNVLLPRELFAVLWRRFPEKAHLRFIGGDAVRILWRIAHEAEETWFMEHPLKSEVLERPDLHVPVRVWGDDAPVGKHGRSI